LSVARAQGERSDEETATLNTRIKALTVQLEGVNAQHTMLLAQVRKAEDDLEHANSMRTRLTREREEVRPSLTASAPNAQQRESVYSKQSVQQAGVCSAYRGGVAGRCMQRMQSVWHWPTARTGGGRMCTLKHYTAPRHGWQVTHTLRTGAIGSSSSQPGGGHAEPCGEARYSRAAAEAGGPGRAEA
jgi:hypothetical protein